MTNPNASTVAGRVATRALNNQIIAVADQAANVREAANTSINSVDIHGGVTASYACIAARPHQTTDVANRAADAANPRDRIIASANHGSGIDFAPVGEPDQSTHVLGALYNAGYIDLIGRRGRTEVGNQAVQVITNQPADTRGSGHRRRARHPIGENLAVIAAGIIVVVITQQAADLVGTAHGGVANGIANYVGVAIAANQPPY